MRYDLYRNALDRWGADSQRKMVIEELAELIVKLCKYGRNVNGSPVSEIIEEIADVEIMLEQLKMMFDVDVDKLLNIKNRKLKRLEKLLVSSGDKENG